MTLTSKILSELDKFISDEHFIIHADIESYDNSIGLEAQINQQIKQEINDRRVPGTPKEVELQPMFTGIKRKLTVIKTSEFGNYYQWVGAWSFGTSLVVIHLVTAEQKLLQEIVFKDLTGKKTKRQIFIIIQLITWIKLVEHAIRQALETYQIGKKSDRESSKVSIVDFKPDIFNLNKIGV